MCMVGRACKFPTQKVEAEPSEVQGHPQLPKSLRAVWATGDPVSTNEKKKKPTEAVSTNKMIS